MNALVPIYTLTPAVFSEPGGIDALLQKLEVEVRSVPTDISTARGRKEIAALAFKVAKSKTAFDAMGKELAAEWKKKAGAVDKERAKVWDRLEALQAEVRAPLTEWEDAEKRRIDAHEAALRAIVSHAGFLDQDPSAAQVTSRLALLEQIPERDWQEFKQRAAAARAETFAKLQVLKSSAIAREAEAAELARLRADEAARLQAERDAEIARRAAEDARKDAEAKAAREAAAAAERAAAVQRKADQERAEALAKAEKAERERLATEQRAADAAAAAERARIAAIAKAETDRQAAVQAERKRAEDAAAAEHAEAQRREADREHRRTIHSKALEALVAAGLSVDQGTAAIVAIARGSVPHITISY